MLHPQIVIRAILFYGATKIEMGHSLRASNVTRVLMLTSMIGAQQAGCSDVRVKVSLQQTTLYTMYSRT